VGKKVKKDKKRRKSKHDAHSPPMSPTEGTPAATPGPVIWWTDNARGHVELLGHGMIPKHSELLPPISFYLSFSHGVFFLVKMIPYGGLETWTLAFFTS
jgi:hypothetical protein